MKICAGISLILLHFILVDIKADILSAEIDLWIRSGMQSDILKQAVKSLALPTALHKKDWKTFEGIQGIAVCTICQDVVKTIVTLRKGGTSSENITNTMADICTLLNIQTKEVCHGFITLNVPIILKIVDSKDKVHARDICGVILQSENCNTESSEFEWTITVDKSPPTKNSVPISDKIIKIVQITDIHYDPRYEVNGNADCSEPACCRHGQNSTNKHGKLAGYWGDYNYCDAPWHTFVDALNQIKIAHRDTEHIYFTGDILAHQVWDTTREGNTETLAKSYNLIRNAFPDSKVYPILGNHEPHPSNVFAPHDIEDKELSTVWLYELMADTWIGNGWLPESTRSTILRGGFYTVSPRKGFRIIALNNNVCNTLNWWILYQPKDQDGQLIWLMETLLQAEKDGEFVHILAHIPPDGSSSRAKKTKMPTGKPKSTYRKPGRPRKNYDLSNLRQPFKTSISNLKEVVKLFESSTPEIKDLLIHEVNILYECRICRSIYRSLLNIVSHKRAFCKEKVNVTSENKSLDDQSPNVTLSDMQRLDLDESTFDILDKQTEDGRILRSQAPSKPQKKDLTGVVHMLQKKQEESFDGDVEQNQKHKKVQIEKDNCDQVILQVMESKRAAFQTLVEPNLSSVDLMENQVMELDSMSKNNQDTTVTLRTDGLIEKSDSPVDFYSNEEETDKLTCEICARTFSTRKTLNSHMKTLHAPVRICYLCPFSECSLYNFGSPASVKRHLTNVHKKIGNELKELGERIEETVVKSKPIPTLPNKKPKKPENPCNNTVGESQVWLERIDRQEFQDCSLCGRRFNSRAEFMNHSENCIGQNDVSPQETGANNQGLLVNEDCEVVPRVNENLVELTSRKEQEIVSRIASPILIANVRTLNEEDWLNNIPFSSKNEESSNRVNSSVTSLHPEVTIIRKPNKPVIADSRILESPQIVFSNVDNTKKRKVCSLIEVNGQSSQGETSKKANIESDTVNVESGSLSAQNVEAKIALMSDPTKLECRPCKLTFTSLWSFNRHSDSHTKINRYRCNKCDYKSVTKNDCIGHCNRKHNGMNNRQLLNEMISTIPQDQLIISQEMDLSNFSSQDVLRSSSAAVSCIRSITPVTDLLQKQHNELVNVSDSETETEDGDTLRKIEMMPMKPDEILKIIGGSNSTPPAPESNINQVNMSHIQNNNLEKSGQILEYSPALEENSCSANYTDEEDDISFELYDRSRSISRTCESRNRSESRSGSQMETRSSSRLGRKLDSDYEDEDEDEITPESQKTRSRKRNRSPSWNRSTIITRSRSRGRKQSALGIEENQEDPWKGYSRDLSTEDVKSRSRSLSQTVKEPNSAKIRSASRQGRGKRRGRPPGRGTKTRSISRGREERSESFSSESSQIQRSEFLVNI